MSNNDMFSERTSLPIYENSLLRSTKKMYVLSTGLGTQLAGEGDCRARICFALMRLPFVSIGFSHQLKQKTILPSIFHKSAKAFTKILKSIFLKEPFIKII